MSYITSFVQSQSASAKDITATNKKAMPAKTAAGFQKDFAKKILLFIAIITCLVMAVTI